MKGFSLICIYRISYHKYNPLTFCFHNRYFVNNAQSFWSQFCSARYEIFKNFLHGTGHRQNLSSMSFILSTHIYFIVVRSQLNARRATLRLVMTMKAHSRETDYKEKPQNLLYLVNSLFSSVVLIYVGVRFYTRCAWTTWHTTGL